MIRVDALWLACEPFDMRAGTETALARVVAVFGQAKPHHAYLFANRRAIGSYKNPHSHRKQALAANEAREMLILASHLLRIVDTRGLAPN